MQAFSHSHILFVIQKLTLHQQNFTLGVKTKAYALSGMLSGVKQYEKMLLPSVKEILLVVENLLCRFRLV